MNTLSSFPLKPWDPAEWHATEELVEIQGSEPGNRLVKEPATTASSMGYKQHWVDLKQSAEGGLKDVKDIWGERGWLLYLLIGLMFVQSGVHGLFFLCPYRICFLVRLCPLTIFCPSPLLALHSPAEGKADPKVKNILLLSPSWTSVSVVLAAAPTLTPPDGKPAGSVEVLPTEMAGITPLQWSPTLVFCTVPFFVVESVTIHHIDCRLPSPWPCDSSEEEAFGL